MIRILFVIIIFISVGNAQLYYHNEHQTKKPITSDVQKITKLIKVLSYAIRNNKSDQVLSMFLSDNYKNSNVSKKNNMTLGDVIQVENIEVSVNGESATANCTVSDENLFSKSERISFVHEKNKWKISESTFLIEFARQKMMDYKQKMSGKLKDPILKITSVDKWSKIKEAKLAQPNDFTQNSISYFEYSTTALIKKDVIYSGGRMTLNRQVTQNQLGKNLFAVPTNGKTLSLYKTNIFDPAKAVTIISDAHWNRIVLANYTNSSIISYGDNTGDESLSSPTSVSMDKYGNIFVLCTAPVKVVRLKYYESSNTIQFVGNVPIYLVQYPVDLCLDDGGSPNDASDDSFWLADEQDNSILHFKWDGTLLGKYSHIINGNTSEQIDLLKPTKIVVRNDFDLSLYVIDSNKKRVIILPYMSNYNGNTITGGTFNGWSYQSTDHIIATQFTNDVSLTSIAFDENNGVWITDETNNALHIFDAFWGQGYLATVTSLGGQSQWYKPQNASTTSMSNSQDYLSDELITLDQWDDTHGINNYYFGCDILNPTTSVNGSNINISATATNDCNVVAKIYNQSGNLLNTTNSFERAQGNDVFLSATPSMVGNNLIGKYRANFTITPIHNSSYGSYQQQVTKDVWFAFPMNGNLTGSNQGSPGTNLSWETVLTSGSGDYHYIVYQLEDGDEYPTQLTSGYSNGSINFTKTMGVKSFKLMCVIMDNFNNSVIEFDKDISCITQSGSLSSNEIWSGAINLTGSVTVPSNYTLTIQPGTLVTFPSGASLTASGKLISNGTSSSKITLTSTGSQSAGSWGSIIISGTGANGSSISNANILYGSKIQVVGASNVNIQNSFINNVYYGIDFTSNATGSIINNFLTSSTSYHGIVIEGGAIVQCDENTIIKTGSKSGAGILYSAGGYGTLWKNNISGWNWGVGAIYGSSPEFAYSTGEINSINNQITNCSYGIYANNSSWPLIGDVDYAGYNSIFSNTKDIYFTSGGNLYARYTYWGGNAPNPSTQFTLGSGCSVYTQNWLSQNPWTSQQSPVLLTKKFDKKTESSEHMVVSSTGAGRRKYNGIKLRRENRFNEAKEFFKSYLSNDPDDQSGYVELYKCDSKETRQDLINYFSKLPPKADKEHQLLLSNLYLRNGDIESAQRVLDGLILTNKTNKVGARAQIKKFYIALYSENNFMKAKAILSKVNTNVNLLTVDIELAQSALATYQGSENEKTKKLLKQSTLATPETYDLKQNYPNPFNPSTTIDYQIPKDGHVMMKVYDVLGKEVATLVNEQKSVGRYSTIFDGAHLASGTYIVRMISRADGGSAKDKFVKTMKVMLMK